MLVTDVANETVSNHRTGAGLVAARVVWIDLRGNVLDDRVQSIDPAAPDPESPLGARGPLVARIHVPGQAVTAIHRFVGGN